MKYISTLQSDQSRLVLDVTWTPNVLHTTCKELDNLTKLSVSCSHFIAEFYFISPISILPSIYAQNIIKMTTPTNLFTRSCYLFLSLSENSMKLKSFCEKHLLAGHIKKSENRKCLWYMTLVPHLPRKP